MAKQCPQVLEGFLCHCLSPVLAELLTSKFEAADVELAQQGPHLMTGSAGDVWVAGATVDPKCSSFQCFAFMALMECCSSRAA
jgi:hypothetical protein